MQLPALAALPDELTAEDFWRLVGKVEHERLDFKEQVRDLRETIAAMAMTYGGIIALGISDSRSIVGCPETQQTVDAIADETRSCVPPVPIERRGITVDGVGVVLISIPPVSDHIVTTASGRLLHRVGSSNVPILGDDVRRFVLTRLPSYVTAEELRRAVEQAKHEATSAARSWAMTMGLG